MDNQYRKLVEERLEFNLLPPGQFIQQEFPKKTIPLHHTAGGSAASSIAGWIADVSPVATPVIIDRDGSIIQSYPSKYYAYSLGCQTANFRELENQAIPIEIACYGYMIKKNGVFYNAYGGVVQPDNVYDHGKLFRGNQFFEKYTAAQIESTRRLLLYWGEKYGIDLTYRPEMFDISPAALRGDGGIWGHTAYRKDKSDIYPYPPMIEMLKSLKK